MNEIVEKYFKENFVGKSSSCRKRVEWMNNILEDLGKPINEVTKDDLIGIIDRMYKGTLKTVDKKIKPRSYNPYTIEILKLTLRHFFRWYGKPELVDWMKINTRKAYKHKTMTDMIDFETIKTMISVCTNKRDQCIIAILWDTAIRSCELKGMKIKNIIIKNGKMSIDVDGKTGQRNVPVNFAVPYVNAYLSDHPFKNDLSKPFFITRFGDRLYGMTLEDIIKKVSIKAGIKQHITPHIIRHSRLTNLAEKGVQESIMRQFAGWSEDSTMPSIYIHIANKKMKEVIYNLDDDANTVEKQIELGVEQRIKQEKEKWEEEVMKKFIDTYIKGKKKKK